VVGSCRDAGWFWAGRVVYLRVERHGRDRSRRGERFRDALTAVLRVRQMESQKQHLLQRYAPRLLAFFRLPLALQPAALLPQQGVFSSRRFTLKTKSVF
jgi:hypothetical protein